MRTFEERKTEIFLRSEERITKHKQTRNRIIVSIIPLLVVAAVLSINLLPKSLPAVQDNTSTTTDTTTTTLSVKVRDSSESSENYYAVKDAESAMILLDNIVENEVALDVPMPTENSKLQDAAASQSRFSTYIIVVTESNGMQTTYKLSHYTLHDLSADKMYALTDEEYENLKEALSIPQK